MGSIDLYQPKFLYRKSTHTFQGGRQKNPHLSGGGAESTHTFQGGAESTHTFQPERCGLGENNFSVLV